MGLNGHENLEEVRKNGSPYTVLIGVEKVDELLGERAERSLTAHLVWVSEKL